MCCQTSRIRRRLFVITLLSVACLIWQLLIVAPASPAAPTQPAVVTDQTKATKAVSKPRVNSISKYLVRYVTCDTSIGRLGNKMFQFASMYGTAKKYNLVPSLKNDETVLKFFEHGALQAEILPVEMWKSLNWKTWQEPQASSYYGASLEAALEGTDNILLERFLQSFKYFSGFEAEIVKQFVFKQPTRTWAENYMRNISAAVPKSVNNVTYVGMHIRRGDYLLPVLRDAGYNTPTDEYYLKAVQYFTQRFPFVVFIVCSNEIKWAKEFFLNNTEYSRDSNVTFEFVTGAENLPDKDMALLSLANHTVLSVGSYSFWAAMLRQYRSGQSDSGISIYYPKPFVYHRPIANTYNNRTDDYYPPDWIPLE